MYCASCGTELPHNSRFCTRCGTQIYLRNEPYYAGGTPPPRNPSQVEVPDYLPWSIVVTVLCCIPFGIPAIINSTRVGARLAAGDMDGAWQASESAKNWIWLALIFGLLFDGILVIASFKG